MLKAKTKIKLYILSTNLNNAILQLFCPAFDFGWITSIFAVVDKINKTVYEYIRNGIIYF